MRKTLFLFCLLTVTAATISLAGISVDHDKSADFSKYRTFTIIEASKAVNPLMRQRLINAIEVELGSDGLENVEQGADIKVVIHVSTDTQQLITGRRLGLRRVSPLGRLGSLGHDDR